ncbi:protein-disulfide reductase DsbD family protein [Thiomonas sp.]
MDISLLLEVMLALGAGMLLNLTPCVLPVIPIKVRTILREAGEKPATRALSASLFAAGSLLFFTPLGLATALLHLQWGVLFQSQAVLIGLVIVLLAMAVMNFTGRGLPIPPAIARMGGGRFAEPLISGLVSALLSSPCTGPLLGGILVFALTRPATEIVVIFMAIGLGLALPYAVLLLKPGLLDRLPRGGAWTDVVRQSFGWLLAGAAVFFAQSLVPAMLDKALWFSLVVGIMLWVFATSIRAADRASRWAAPLSSLPSLALVYLSAGIWPAPSQGIPWQPLKAAQITEIASLHRPALVEFTAQWCLNCRFLEKTVYRDSRVVQALRAGRVVPLQVDLTRPNPELQQLLAAYGGDGLPFVAILDRHGREIDHLSGLFTADALLGDLNAIHR